MLSGDIRQLIFFRVIQGVGAAMQFSTGMAMLTAAFEPHERGRALGINVGIVYLGLSGGPFLGGLLVQYLGWRSLFAVNAIFGLLLLFLVARILKFKELKVSGTFDLPGALLYGLSIFFVMMGLSEIRFHHGMIMLCIGLVLAVIFVFYSVRIPHPVLDVRLFLKNRVFAFSGFAALINYSATHGVGLILSLFLQYVKGMSPKTAGIVLVTQPLIQALVSPYAGRLSDKVEPRYIATAGMLLVMTGLLILLPLGAGSHLGFIILAMFFLGLGIALFSAPNTNAVMSSVDERHLGVASGILSTMRVIGQTISLVFVTMMFSVMMGPGVSAHDNIPAFLGTVRTDLGVFAFLCLIGAALSLVRGNVRVVEKA